MDSVKWHWLDFSDFTVFRIGEMLFTLVLPEKGGHALLVAQLVKNCLQCGRPGFDPWVGKSPWRRERLPTPVF